MSMLRSVPLRYRVVAAAAAAARISFAVARDSHVHTGSNGNANRGAICVDMEEARKVARDVSLPVLDGERPDHCTPGERPA